ncbi:MAG TPA: hypothetical protein VF115_04025 [Acidimicrobiia bacterium]
MSEHVLAWLALRPRHRGQLCTAHSKSTWSARDEAVDHWVFETAETHDVEEKGPIERYLLVLEEHKPGPVETYLLVLEEQKPYPRLTYHRERNRARDVPNRSSRLLRIAPDGSRP